MTDGPTIRPTHACFDDVVDYVNELLRHRAADGARLEEIRLVHGLIVAPGGERCAHAWIESRDEVIQGGIYEGERIWFIIRRADFDAHYKVAKATRYTVAEAIGLQRAHGAGPWEAEYKAACSASTQTWTLEEKGSGS